MVGSFSKFLNFENPKIHVQYLDAHGFGPDKTRISKLCVDLIYHFLLSLNQLVAESQFYLK
jgi:hypothetical protein